MFKWFRRRREAARLARADADALVRGHGKEAYRLAPILGSFRGVGTARGYSRSSARRSRIGRRRVHRRERRRSGRALAQRGQIGRTAYAETVRSEGVPAWEGSGMTLTPDQVKAGRELAGWSRLKLAARVNVCDELSAATGEAKARLQRLTS